MKLRDEYDSLDDIKEGPGYTEKLAVGQAEGKVGSSITSR